MLFFSWLYDILDALPSCTGSSSSSDYIPEGEEEEVMMEVDADDKTWCSTQWIGGMKHTLNDDVTLATKDDYTLATKDDFTVATCPTDSSSEKS